MSLLEHESWSPSLYFLLLLRLQIYYMKTTFSRTVQGCMGWGSWGHDLSASEMTQRINFCVEQGITTFDHADIYGDYSTEETYGKALSQAGINRETIQLISKCGIQYVGKARDNAIKHYQYDAEYIIWSAERSIKLLQAEYLDLFLLHRPSPLLQPEEVVKAIETLLDTGKIRAFGVSNFTPSQTRLLSKYVPVSVNQIEFSLTHFQPMLQGDLDMMISKDITPMAWSPLGSVFKEDSEQTKRIHTVLENLTKKYSATKDQLLLGWILKHPAMIHPVIGTSTESRIAQAVAAEHIALEETDWFALWVASQGHKVP